MTSSRQLAFTSPASTPITRRTFCSRASTSIAGISALSASQLMAQKESPNEKIVIAVMGTNGRGSALARQFAGTPNCEVGGICDVDSRAIEKGMKTVATTNQKRTPKTATDIRKLIEDKDIDAIAIAAPDHWHAPAAIMAVNANKHVYCEKPCCHNPHEGELLVATTRKHKRTVQHGTQRRTWSGVVEAIQKLHSGVIGKVLMARCWYFNNRPSIGKGKQTSVPSWLDWELWQGPAPEMPFKDNIVHYNWHWLWHWGTSEIGNNGVHFLDVCRWGLQVDYPDVVTCGGGRYRYEDDQETPDTSTATFHFGNRMIIWDGRSWGGRHSTDAGYDVAFAGEKGILAIQGSRYKIFNADREEIDSGSGKAGDQEHLSNFLAGIRGDAPLNAEIEEGYKSALMCHLGNMAYRSGKTIHCDNKTGKPTDASIQKSYWNREYRLNWEPTVS